MGAGAAVLRRDRRLDWRPDGTGARHQRAAARRHCASDGQFRADPTPGPVPDRGRSGRRGSRLVRRGIHSGGGLRLGPGARRQCSLPGVAGLRRTAGRGDRPADLQSGSSARSGAAGRSAVPGGAPGRRRPGGDAADGQSGRQLGEGSGLRLAAGRCTGHVPAATGSGGIARFARDGIRYLQRCSAPARSGGRLGRFQRRDDVRQSRLGTAGRRSPGRCARAQVPRLPAPGGPRPDRIGFRALDQRTPRSPGLRGAVDFGRWQRALDGPAGGPLRARGRRGDRRSGHAA